MQDDFEHFCSVLARFNMAQQGAFEEAWNEGDVQKMIAVCEASVNNPHGSGKETTMS
jgi:hypothetical protein